MIRSPFVARGSSLSLGLFVFLAGAASAFLVIPSQLVYASLLSPVMAVAPSHLLVGPVVLAPFLEEHLKPLGVYLLSARDPSLRPGQCAILGFIAGLGFALVELVSYAQAASGGVRVPWLTVVALRLPTATLLHGTWTALVGLGIAKSAQSGGSLWTLYGRGLVPAMAIHGCYNALVISAGV